MCKNDNIVKDIGDNILDFTVYLSTSLQKLASSFHSGNNYLDMFLREPVSLAPNTNAAAAWSPVSWQEGKSGSQRLSLP